MNNYKVLLKYSLKPKITSKKAILGIGGIFAFVAVIVIGVGLLADNLFDDQNPLANLVADQVYVYPDNDVSKAIISLMPDVELTDNPEFTTEMTESDDDISIINTETNIITSNYLIDTVAETTLTSIVIQAQNLVAIQTIPVEHRQAIIDSQNPPTFESTTDESENSDFLYGVSFASTLVIYFAIIFGIQLLGSEVFEEKSSRAMEIIITNVKPTAHMLVKITSTFIFILAIGLAVILGAVVGIVTLKFISPNSIGVLVDLLVDYLQEINIVINSELFIFSGLVLISSIFAILLFQILAAVTAAMTTSYEDYQKANGPVIIFLLIPYFISIFGVDLFSKVLVYIPFFTPFFAPKLYLSNEFTLIGFALAILIQFVSIIILFKLSAPIYREGLLNYSTSSLKQIIKRAYQK